MPTKISNQKAAKPSGKTMVNKSKQVVNKAVEEPIEVAALEGKVGFNSTQAANEDVV